MVARRAHNPQVEGSIPSPATKFMFFYVYIIYSAQKDKFYIGQTNNLKQRVERHTQGRVLSTKYGKPWKLVYNKKFETRSKAMEFEHYLKSKKSKNSITKIIEISRQNKK